MIINNNIPAMNTHRQMGINQGNMQSSMEKLSSGMRINKAGDDAAGLAISEKMRAQINGLDQASRNSQDGISMIQTAEGALDETHSILQRMRELAVQSANDTNTDTDREELQKEVDQLSSEINRISDTTEFNTKNLLNGDLQGVKEADEFVKFENNSASFSGVAITASGTSEDNTYNIKITDATSGSGDFTVEWTDANGVTNSGTVAAAGGDVIVGEFTVTLGALTSDNIGDEATITGREAVENFDDKSLSFQVGANSSQTISVGIGDMSASGLNVNSLDLTTSQGAGAGISAINQAIEDVSAERSNLGSIQNRLEHTISNLDNSSENLSAAESRVRDVDMAKEMMEMTSANILSQASQSMLAQANQQPQSVLQLLG